jgi:hypothetical protein
MSSQPIKPGEPHTSVPNLWWIWLVVVSVAGSIGGVVLAFGSALFPPALDAIYSFVFGSDAAVSMSVADRVLFNVTVAIGGGLQAGASAMIGFVSYHALRWGKRWAWNACVLGLALWLLLDTGLTAWYFFNGYPGLWPKIVNDLSFVVMFGLPYIALYRYCNQ